MSIESWQTTTKKMETLGVVLPPEKSLSYHILKPTLLIVSRLMSQQGNEYGVSASYIPTNVEVGANPSKRELNLNISDSVILLCNNIRSIGGRALMFGGSIRDAIYNQVHNKELATKDIDLEIYGLEFDTVLHLLKKTFPNVKIDCNGESFSVIKIYINGTKQEPLDVVITRIDVSKGVGSREFDTYKIPNLNFCEATKRRDLRFNSASYDPLAKILYDPNLAEIDIIKSEINVTSEKTFVEDPLRVLRVMQFAARFEMKPTQATIELCSRMVAKNKLDTLAIERVRDELIKLLVKSEKPSIGLKFAREIGFIQKYWPELNNLIGTKQHQKFHKEGDVWNHTLQNIDAAALIARREELNKKQTLILVLTLLCHDFGKPSTTKLIDGIYRAHGHAKAGVDPARVFMQRLKFSNEVIDNVLPLVEKHMNIPPLHRYEVHPQEGRESINADAALMRLARQLWTKKQISLSFLMLVVEADHKGRNGEIDQPFSDEELPQIVELRNWLKDKTEKLKINQTAAKPLLDNSAFLKETELKPGVWFGLIAKCVLLDQDEGLIKSPEEACQNARQYFMLMKNIINPNHNCDNLEYHQKWTEMLKNQDPRIELLPK